MPKTHAARLVLEGALGSRVFPAATVDVGSSVGSLWQDALDTPLDTPFDLASLTKPIATTTIVMDLVHRRPPESRRAACARRSRSGAVSIVPNVTVRDLLEHASGLAARLVDAPPIGRREFEHEICSMPLEYAPRTRSIYSDLGIHPAGFPGGGSRPGDARRAVRATRRSNSRRA